MTGKTTNLALNAENFINPAKPSAPTWGG